MKRILLVDDVEVVRHVIGRMLKKAGHTVFEAKDGAEALAMAEAQPMDVVLTDLWMPGCDGVHLLAAMRARFPGVARVAMSGGSPEIGPADSFDAATKAGAVEMIMKPVDRGELLQAIDDAVLRGTLIREV